ncbi:MAG: FG-GAP-like repeat-containing protein [Bacteroidota bacterium]
MKTTLLSFVALMSIPIGVLASINVNHDFIPSQTGNSHSFPVFQNSTEDEFSSGLMVANSSPAYSVFAADIDLDGDLDLVYASRDEDKVAWFRNNGNGEFDDEIIISNTALSTYVVAGEDLDNDGDIDVVSTASTSDIIAIHLNQGDGNFDPEIIISTSANSTRSLHLEDMDQDGLIDIIAGDFLDAQISWYKNLGNGSFGPEIVVSDMPSGITSVFAGDFDNDGDMDLASCGFNDEVAWYQNLGDGVFSSEIIISDQAHRAQSVHAADLDNDGLIDLLSASEFNDKIAWYKNLGGGEFEEQTPISTTASFAHSVSVGDMDGDGRIDVLSASWNDGKVAWYRNLGQGVFESESVISTSGGILRDVIAADLDQDGDLDVVSAGQGNSRVQWYKNTIGEGCTDEIACNYDPQAYNDDGSCCYENCGCMDPVAENYDVSATCDNNTCEYTQGCTNQIASNYNPEAIVEDGSCIFIVTGVVFDDLNLNGVFDAGDYGIPNYQVNIIPFDVTLITNDSGEFSYTYDGEVPISFEITPNQAFPFNTSPASVLFNPENSLDSSVEFGISNQVEAFAICVDLYPFALGFLCNEWIPHNICFRNEGNVAISGVVELEYDPLFQGHQEVTPISFEEGNIVQMTFENLQPGQMFFYGIDLLSPTVDHIGEFVTSHARITGFYEGEQVAYGEKTLEMEVTCAYDPNDKLAFPLGFTDEHLLLQETEQEFVVRFQNTGNAPAQDVQIQDTLEINFDIESFRLIANSHSVMTTIDPETRLIDFFFEDIQLPDSTNNEPESHGLVSYKVTPLPDLPVGTVLENTAYIYFDNNEPIITNTTWTTIHECGGETSYEASSGFVCNEVQANFESTYPWIERYSWEVEGEEVGDQAQYNGPTGGQDPFEIIFTASNPLCEESSTIEYDVLDIGLLTPCDADFNCDGNRDTEDILEFLSTFGCAENCATDLDNSNTVGGNDLLIFLALFNQTCWQQ